MIFANVSTFRDPVIAAAKLTMDISPLPDPVMAAMKMLAVLGGVTLGAIAFDLLARLIHRRFSSKPTPRPAKILMRILGGALLGGLVWLWVFSSGQGGFGGSGGGWWPFGQGGHKGPPGDANATVKDKAPPGKGKAEPLPIHILGGQRVVDERFYVIDTDPPRTWSEAQTAILDRQHKNPDLKEIEIFIYTDSVDRENPAVTALEKWARGVGLTPKLTQPDRKAP